MILQSRGLVTSPGMLTPLYLDYQNAFGHKTWQVGDLPYGLLTLYNHYISATTTATYLLKFTWSYRIVWQTKKIISLPPQYLWSPKVAQWWYAMIRAPTHKTTWPFNDVVLWDHMTNYNHYIPTTTMHVATKLDQVVICFDGSSPTRSKDNLVT